MKVEEISAFLKDLMDKNNTFVYCNKRQVGKTVALTAMVDEDPEGLLVVYNFQMAKEFVRGGKAHPSKVCSVNRLENILSMNVKKVNVYLDDMPYKDLAKALNIICKHPDKFCLMKVIIGEYSRGEEYPIINGPYDVDPNIFY